MMKKLAEIKKAVGAFLGATLVAVPIGLATAAKYWAVAVPVVTALATYFAPKNTPAPPA